MLNALFNCLREAHSQQDVKAIVVTGSKGKFSAGFDINQFAKSGGGGIDSRYRYLYTLSPHCAAAITQTRTQLSKCCNHVTCVLITAAGSMTTSVRCWRADPSRRLQPSNPWPSAAAWRWPWPATHASAPQVCTHHLTCFLQTRTIPFLLLAWGRRRSQSSTDCVILGQATLPPACLLPGIPATPFLLLGLVADGHWAY